MTQYDKLIAAQPELKKIWVEAMQEDVGNSGQRMVVSNVDDKGVEHVDESGVIRRGYKIMYTRKSGLFELLRITTSDYYKWATDAEIKLFLTHGFCTACDILQIKRNRAKINRLNKKIDNANSERNDSLMVHWRRRRKELIDNIIYVTEGMQQRNQLV